jgi:hypothetical protein
MIITINQPIFSAWPGFFLKPMKADCMVLLDDVHAGYLAQLRRKEPGYYLFKVK